MLAFTYVPRFPPPTGVVGTQPVYTDSFHFSCVYIISSGGPRQRRASKALHFPNALFGCAPPPPPPPRQCSSWRSPPLILMCTAVVCMNSYIKHGGDSGLVSHKLPRGRQHKGNNSTAVSKHSSRSRRSSRHSSFGLCVRIERGSGFHLQWLVSKV